MNTQMVKVCGTELEAGTDKDAKVWVSVKRVCDVLGVAEQRQIAKLKTKKWAGATMMVVPSAGGAQRTMMLPLRAFPMWLANISPTKVRPEARETLEKFQLEAAEVLAKHFLPKMRAKEPSKLSSFRAATERARLCLRGAEIANILTGDTSRDLQTEFLTTALTYLDGNANTPAAKAVRKVKEVLSKTLDKTMSVIETTAEVIDEPPTPVMPAVRASMVARLSTEPGNTTLPEITKPLYGIIRCPEMRSSVPQEEGGLDIPEGNECDLLSVSETADFYGLSKQMIGRVVTWIQKNTKVDLRTHSKYTQRLVVAPKNADGAEFEVYSLNATGRTFFARQLENFMRANPNAISKLLPEHRVNIFRAA